jgi:hypothetical protein
MTNKVRPSTLGLRVPEQEHNGPELIMLTAGAGSIQDVTQPLASKRYIATLVLDAEGWILNVIAPPSSHGPFASAGATFEWWLAHRHALPASRVVPRSGGSWPPGIDEDWAEHDEGPPDAPCGTPGGCVLLGQRVGHCVAGRDDDCGSRHGSRDDGAHTAS